MEDDVAGLLGGARLRFFGLSWSLSSESELDSESESESDPPESVVDRLGEDGAELAASFRSWMRRSWSVTADG